MEVRQFSELKDAAVFDMQILRLKTHFSSSANLDPVPNPYS
jgi:hypothetical protein